MSKDKKRVLKVGIASVAAIVAAGFVGASLYAANNNTPLVQSAVAQDSAEEAVFDLAAALEPRVLGNPDAPVEIREFSSLTCPHCAAFHAETFDKIKEAYIDTGKAKLVFSDFPLNAPAMSASALARCIDKDRYFDFIKLLFKTQEGWSHSPDYVLTLKQNAKLAGLSDALADTCLASEDLKKGLAESMSEAQKQHNVQSTPTFVVGDKVLQGGAPFEEFSKVLDEAYAAATAKGGQ